MLDGELGVWGWYVSGFFIGWEMKRFLRESKVKRSSRAGNLNGERGGWWAGGGARRVGFFAFFAILETGLRTAEYNGRWHV